MRSGFSRLALYATISLGEGFFIASGIRRENMIASAAFVNR